MTERRKVRTCRWFPRGGIDAAQFYVDLLPDSWIDAVFEHSPAASISVLTKDQAETERLGPAGSLDDHFPASSVVTVRTR